MIPVEIIQKVKLGVASCDFGYWVIPVRISISFTRLPNHDRYPKGDDRNDVEGSVSQSLQVAAVTLVQGRYDERLNQQFLDLLKVVT